MFSHPGRARWWSLRQLISALLIAVAAAAVPAATVGAPLARGGVLPSGSSSGDGPPAESSKVVLNETSIDGPALWTSNPSGSAPSLASVLAWTGTDPNHSLSILPSSDGVTYLDRQRVTFAESSQSRPAVAAQGAVIVLAWTGTDASHTLNLLCHGGGCGAERKLTIAGATSFTSPALVAFGSGFLLAWAESGARHALDVLPVRLASAGSGFVLGTRTSLGAFTSLTAPSLSLNPQNDQLLLTWAATSPAGQLTFATSRDGVTWSAAQALAGATTTAAPDGFTAAAANSMPPYWMTWVSPGPAHAIVVRVTSNFPQWPLDGSQATLGETALGGPALGYVGYAGRALLAWSGADVEHRLTVATVTTIPLDQRIAAYVSHLSTAQKIGQTLMMSVCASGFDADVSQALAQWDVGSAVIYTSCNGGSAEPPTAAGVHQLDQAMQSHASPPGSLLLAIDEEGGSVDRLAAYYGGTPSARQLAQTSNPRNAYAQAQTDAARLRALGLNLDFAPVTDVDQGGGIGASRTFGTTAGSVITYAGAFLDGLQQHGIVGTLKHWPGLGAATGNPDFTLPTIPSSQAHMSAVDFAPYRALLPHQPGMVMVTSVLVPAFDAANPADLSPELVTAVLRGQLGYQGVVVTDALGAQGLILYMKQQGYQNPTRGIAEASVRAFLAGDDLLLCPPAQSQLQAIQATMASAVQSGRISQLRLNVTVSRIIRLKVEQGLMSLP